MKTPTQNFLYTNVYSNIICGSSTNAQYKQIDVMENSFKKKLSNIDATTWKQPNILTESQSQKDIFLCTCEKSPK